MKFNSNVVCGMIFFFKVLTPLYMVFKSKIAYFVAPNKRSSELYKKDYQKKSQPNLYMTPLLKYIGKNIKGASL